MSDNEERTVEVHERGLSAKANQTLTAEARSAVGADQVSVPEDRPHLEDGQASPQRALGVNAVMGVMAACTGAGVGMIILLNSTDHHWWWLALAMIVLALSLAVVVRSIIGLTEIGESPSPTSTALLQEEGVRQPDRELSAIVEEFTPVPADGSDDRTAESGEDPATAAAEQQSAVTPTSGPSRAVGPGD